MPTMSDKIEEFLGSKVFAVAGASKDPTKYGYKVFVALKTSGREVFRSTQMPARSMERRRSLTWQAYRKFLKLYRWSHHPP